MSDKLTTIIAKGVQYLLIIIGVVLLITIFTGEDTNPENGAYIHAEGAIMGYLLMGEWMMYLCAGIILLFAIGYTAMNIKQSIPVLIGIVAFGVVLLIAYSMSSSEVIEPWISADPDAINPTESDSKFAGFGLNAVYILGSIAILGIIAGEIVRIFK